MNDSQGYENPVYEVTAAYLKAAFEQVMAAGGGPRDLIDFVLDRFGDAYLPYLLQFLNDVREGAVEPEGYNAEAELAIGGHYVSAAERHRMIGREAYFLAEKRGFVDGSGDEDWVQAERIVEQQLAPMTAAGTRYLEQVSEMLGREPEPDAKAIASWLKKRKAPPKKASSGTVRKKTATKKAVTTKKTATKKVTTAKKAATANKKSASKKVAAKKKTAVAKKSAHTQKKKTAKVEKESAEENA